MTGELTKAVCAVMTAVTRLQKGERNTHGGYNYTSVDAFKDHIRPLMAENGLEVRINEVEHAIETLETKSGKSVSAVFTFEIRLRHTSGEQDDPERTTVMLPHTGAQTTGAAKSYALKEWLKGRFLVSTGEKDQDADSMAPDEYTGGTRTSKPAVPSIADDIIKRLNEADSVVACEQEIGKARQLYTRLPAADKTRVTNAIEARRAYWSAHLEAAE